MDDTFAAALCLFFVIGPSVVLMAIVSSKFAAYRKAEMAQAMKTSHDRSWCQAYGDREKCRNRELIFAARDGQS